PWRRNDWQQGPGWRRDWMKGLPTSARLAVVTVIATGLTVSCGGGTPSSPTAPTPANIAGAYTLVVTASSSCASSLPAAARTITYGAAITQAGSDFQTTLTGSSF